MSEQVELESKLGRWPRRLLHVPTMTSYCWQPGHVYGTFVAPQYNAITYTWGRWMLPTPDLLPHVRPLDIKGVNWSIPRVDPEHFSQDEFMAVIKKIMEPISSTEASSRDAKPSLVEFLWLDIACIDQRAQSPDGAAEIGRQGDIFRGANRVFAWLTTVSGAGLVDLLTNISMPNPAAFEYYSNIQLPRPLSVIQDSLDFLTRDPWFSSLWTLQEAFLRQDTLFIARDGLVAQEVHPSSSEWASQEWPVLVVEQKAVLTFPFSVERLDWICLNLGLFIRADITDSSPEATETALQRDRALRKRIGIGSGWEKSSPMLAFTASAHRTASYESDRIYGIQQVFGFRLGATRVGAPQRVFTREELELELAKEIIAKFPLTSQLFVTEHPREFGHNWRINPDSQPVGGCLDLDWFGGVSF